VWWEYVVIAGVLLFGIYAFVVLVRVQTRIMTRRTSRTAESMYGSYGDPGRKRRRHTTGQAGETSDGEGDGEGS
jgi:hypothetical protein